MKTGDTVRDPNGSSYALGALLGRGLWGQTFAARDPEQPDLELVVKVPLSPSQLGGDRKLADTCAEIAVELGRLHAELGGRGIDGGGMHPLHDRFRTDDDLPVLVFPRAATTWEARLVLGASLEETLATAGRLARMLQELGPSTPFHGNLKPGNVLLDERGNLTLTDVLVPAFQAALPALLGHHPASRPWIPPELRERGGAIPGVSTDTYALCMAIYRGIVVRPEAAGPEALLPLEGLDKARLVGMKDRAHNRLQDEHANPRFHTRLTDRVAALLNRALSRETSPSPPYRFARHDEFRTRLAEVQALVHPAVTHVGRLLLDRPPGRTDFTTDDEVGLSCSVACSQGVETHEEIACGLAIFEEDSGERVRDVPCAYTVSRHPSGRFRFGFTLSELAPGAYRIRIAFTIRESGLEPATAEGSFTVRAAAGYVPPRELPGPQALQMRRDEPVTSVTEPGVHVAQPRVARLAAGFGGRGSATAQVGASARAQEAPAGRSHEGGTHEVSSVAGPRTTAAAVAAAMQATPGPRVQLSPQSARPAPSLMGTVPCMTPDADEAPTAPLSGVVSMEHYLPPAGNAAVALAPAAQVAPAAQPREPAFSEAPTELRRGVAGVRMPSSRSLPPEPGFGPPGPEVTVDEEPDLDDEPEYQGLGRWTDLPLPRTTGEELPSTPVSARYEHTEDLEPEHREDSPLGTALADLFELIRGDAFVLFIGGAAVLIILLVVALILLS